MNKNRVLQLQTLTGRAIPAGAMTLTPLSQALIVRLPFGGLVWQRPLALLVEQEGQTKRIPIPDRTRLGVWLVTGLLVGLGVTGLIIGQMKRRIKS